VSSVMEVACVVVASAMGSPAYYLSEEIGSIDSAATVALADRPHGGQVFAGSS
jgi:hypothetical protein